jgi:cytoskeletal protein CcmA (bactofilin family)
MLSRSEITVLIEPSCRLEGKLYFEGTARLDGEFKGEINGPDTLIIGRNAKIEGQINVAVVVVLGNFEGKINASERVELLKTAQVKGTIESKLLHVEPGGFFEGETKTLRESAEATLTPPHTTVN